MDSLPYWKDDTCNELNGTVPTMFKPPLTSGKSMQTYELEYCRARTFHFEKDEMFKGVSAYFYKFRPDDLYSPEKNPDNWCFCPYDDASKCGVNGIGHLAPCMEGWQNDFSRSYFCVQTSYVI